MRIHAKHFSTPDTKTQEHIRNSTNTHHLDYSAKFVHSNITMVYQTIPVFSFTHKYINFQG